MDKLLYKSYDLMKWTKDVLKSQPDDAFIKKIVHNVAVNVHPTHISIAVPLNGTTEYPASATPSPRNVRDFMGAWTKAIHDEGINVIFRGTFCEIEGIYDFPRKTGGNRVAAQVYYDKIKSLILGAPELFKSGDVWAPLPERTEGIFQDGTSFISPAAPGTQANYTTFFNQLIDVSVAAFQQAGIGGIKTGMTANNYSEVASGWLQQGLFDKAGIVVVDHYGSDDTDGALGHGRKPSDMDRDLRAIASSRGKPVFLQEWANITTGTVADIKAMFDTFTQLTKDGVLVGFNYWDPGAGNTGSIFNSDFSVNEIGKLLGQYYGASAPAPVPTPVPTPTPTPVPVAQKEIVVHLGVNDTKKQIVGAGHITYFAINTKSTGAITLQDGVTGDPVAKVLAVYKAGLAEKDSIVKIPFYNGLEISKSASGDITLVLSLT